MGEEIVSIFKALWNHIHAQGVRISYERPNGGIADAGGGYFHPSPNPLLPDGPHPTIVLVRRQVPARKREPDLHSEHLIDETITLAHEYGHFCSWNEGRVSNAGHPSEEWIAYYQTAKARDALHESIPVNAPLLYRDLDAQQKTLIDEEEKRAWREARMVLTDFGFLDWTVFDLRERRSLHAQRYRLGLDDTWPGD